MDVSRLTGLFNSSIASNPTVVGLGATGSATALQLAKLGLAPHLIDFDVVEGHNLVNQVLYGPDSIGKSKVLAAAEMIYRLTGKRPRGTIDRIENVRSGLGNHVFACVDSNAARCSILEKALRYEALTLYDVRIGVSDIVLYRVDLEDQTMVSRYRDSLHDDSDGVVDRAACGMVQGLLSTALCATSMLVDAYIRDHQYYNRAYPSEADFVPPPSFCRGFCLSTYSSYTINWN